MRYQLTDNITVLGKVIVKPDRSFSFLSYLIRGSKNILVDTVPAKAAEQFLADLKECIPLEELDCLILNHSEEDHSGGLDLLLQHLPDLKIYCTPACRDRLLARFPRANYCPIPSGTSLQTGDHRFIFTHTPGLHWNDNMVTYYYNEKILFSNDLFGQNLGAETPLDSSFSQEDVLNGAVGYFEKVFTPSSLEERAVVSTLFTQEIHTIAPGHGIILNDCLTPVTEYYNKMCAPVATA